MGSTSVGCIRGILLVSLLLAAVLTQPVGAAPVDGSTGVQSIRQSASTTGVVSLNASRVTTDGDTANQSVTVVIDRGAIDAITNDTATATVRIGYAGVYPYALRRTIRNVTVTIDNATVARSDLAAAIEDDRLNDSLLVTTTVTNLTDYAGTDGIQSLSGRVSARVTYTTEEVGGGGIGVYTVGNHTERFAIGPPLPSGLTPPSATTAPPANRTPPHLRGRNLTLAPHTGSVVGITTTNTSVAYTIGLNITGPAANITVYVRAAVIESRVGDLVDTRLILDGYEAAFYPVVHNKTGYVALVIRTGSARSIRFEPDLPYADVNPTGNINTGDVILLQRAIVGLRDLSATRRIQADVTQNGRVDTGDVIQLQRYIVGLPSRLDNLDIGY